MELSRRLQAVASMISKGMVVADLGTDHAYIPIHLIQSGKCEKVYAMDINKGPYLKAKKHVESYGLSDKIITGISDGMKELQSGEANSIIIAGMGGGLVIKILDQDKRLWPQLEEIILQPQSEIHKVREYLEANNFTIEEENIIKEDGKYYPIMKVLNNGYVSGSTKGEAISSIEQNVPATKAYSKVELHYGPKLIEKKHPVLLEFINKEIQVKENLLSKLHEQVSLQYKKKPEEHSAQCHTIEDENKRNDHDKINALYSRIEELKKELELAYEVQRIM